MSRFLLPAPIAVGLLLAACDGRGGDSGPPRPEGELTTIASTDDGVIQAPGGSMSLAVRQDGGPTLVLSAGFLRRAAVTRVALPAEVSWSPDSRRFLVNDAAGLRLWSLDRGGAAVESAAPRDAAIRALVARNGCDPTARERVRTRATAWADDGRSVFVVARAVPEPGGCAFDRSRELSVVVEVETGRIRADPA